MFSRLREHFGTAGLVVAVVALIAALGGAAVAANGGTGGGKAAASASKAKRGPRGPRGPAGPTGPAGPAGAKGDSGAAGHDGSNGANGANGSNGANGQSVSVSVEPPGANCEEGGYKLVSAGPKTDYVCNGVAGANGQTGFTATLPSGSTETGVYLAQGTSDDAFGIFAQVSFNIPLAADLPAAKVHFVTTPEGPCTGSSVNPTAAAGNLCIYSSEALTASTSFVAAYQLDGLAEGASKSGTVLAFATPPAGEPEAPPTAGFIVGAWAVTAE